MNTIVKFPDNGSGYHFMGNYQVLGRGAEGRLQKDAKEEFRYHTAIHAQTYMHTDERHA